MADPVGPVNGVVVIAGLFDRVIVVDWSANATPKRGRDSIWIAVCTASGEPDVVVNPPTRAQAMAWLVDVLTGTTAERVLVGFDFSFGYPNGFAPALTGQPHARWAEVWAWMAAHISDDERNANNRFDVMAQVNEQLTATVGNAPFWGYSGGRRHDALPRTRPGTSEPFPEYRITEQRLRARGHRPFTAWQLAYTGSVGSQMLLGMRALHHLAAHPALHDRLCLWPFDTGFGTQSAQLDRGGVLVAEVWPSMIPVRTDLHPVRDGAQVLTMAHHIAAMDAGGTLHQWFAPTLSEQERNVVVNEEGWTLGVG